MTTLSDLLDALQTADPAHPLVFETSDGSIGAGYHVTELRHSASTGIDCGGNISSWHEARLQLLDGNGSTHMSVGKFRGIATKSLEALPDLAEAPMLVEFGPNNTALSLMSVAAPEVRNGAVFLRLNDARAVCKPAEKIFGDQTMSCCGGGQCVAATQPCCGTQAKATSSACCG